MAHPNSRESLIEYAYRNLGKPVIDINVDYSQAEDRLDEALEYFTERHFDGVERAYFKHVVTADDITNEYVDADNFSALYTDGPTGKDIVSVLNVFQFGDFANINMFDVRYQMALSDYFGINRGLGGSSNLGLASYDSTKRYIGLIEDFFSPQKTVRFNKVTNLIHLDMNWEQEITAGEYLIFEAYVALNPTTFTEIFNDRYLKLYYTALLKRQWGQNMSKFDGVQLPGGVSMRGGEILAEANAEIDKIEEQLKLEYELPIDFNYG